MTYKLLIEHTGEIRWLSASMVSSKCKMDVLHFPFDEQQCSLQFGSWIFDGTLVDLDLHLPYVDREAYSENQEWLFTDNKAEKRVKKYNCCQEPYPSVVFTLVMERRAMSFALNVIIPCALITFSSLFSFILPPNSGERVSFLMTVIVALSVYMMIVSEKMPNSATVPLVSKFFISTMAQQVLSLMATCFIIRFYNNESPIPKWFDVIVNKWLAYLLFMQPKKNPSVPGKDDLIIKRTMFLNEGVPQNENINQSRDITKERSSKFEAPGSGKASFHKDPVTNSTLKEELNKFLVEVKVPADHFRDVNAKEKLQGDWILAANVLDRLFLVLLITSVSISLLLIFFIYK